MGTTTGEDRVSTPAGGMVEQPHYAYVDRLSVGTFYAYCSNDECFWHSRRLRSQTEVEEIARKHERVMSEKIAKRAERRTQLGRAS